MHVLYFYQHFSTTEGSTGTRAYMMAKELVRRGHEVTMVCGSVDTAVTGLENLEAKRGAKTGMCEGIRVIELQLPYSNYDGFLKRSWTFIRYATRGMFIALTTKYDVLFATSTPLTASLPGIAMKVCKPFRPSVFEVRDLWPELPREMGVIKNPVILGAMSVLEKLSYLSARRCIGLSPGICEGIRRRSGKKKPIEMIPNGSHTELFLARDDASERRVRAIFTGSHGVANGLDAVLDAAAVLRDRKEEGIELHFIGNGKLKPHLKERAEKEGLSHCHFHDSVPKRELAAKLKEFDVGMMILANVPAFYFGTSPNKFFDYLATGLPVLNNYPGWLAGIIGEHNIGKAVPPDDPEAFVEALVYLRDHPDERLAMGKRARALADSEFSWALLSKKFADFLEGACA